MRLPEDFYRRDTQTVAREILGKTLCYKASPRKILRGRIVEVEAYLGVEDPAAHTYQGRRTERVKSMWLSGGHAYLYLIYGIHYCLNVVTRDELHPEAVLIRALEPLNPPEGLAGTNGPGRLCKAFGLTREQDGLALFSQDSPLWIEEDGFRVRKSDMVAAPRIGVDYAGEAALWPLRFFLKGNPYVSRKK